MHTNTTTTRKITPKQTAAAAALLITLVWWVGGRSMELDRIIAVVDDDVVMQSELEEQVQQVRAQLRQQGAQMPPTSVLERQVMERLVLEKIQLQLADRSGVEVEENALDQAVEDIASRNNLSPEQFREILESEGFAFDSFRQQIKQEILLAQLRRKEVDGRVKVRRVEIDNYLKNELVSESSALEYRLAHILIAIPSGATEAEQQAMREKVEDIAARVAAGEDFGDLAISVSDGQQALERGDLGWRKGGQIPTLFADSVSNMGVGEASPIITSPSGYHLIKLIDKRTGEKVMVQQHNVRHILIKPNELVTVAQAWQRLKQLRLRLEGGDDFANLAKTHSDDRATALEGGSLGWVAKGKMVPEFEQIMTTIDLNDISQPFRSEFGYHILEVIDRRVIDGTDEVKRDRARRTIRERKVGDRLQNWLRRLRDEAYVEYRSPE